MSAPDTNLKKQRKRHWAPLLAFAVLVVVFASLILIYWPAEEAVTSDGPEGAPVQIDDRTGEISTDRQAFDTDPIEEGDGIVVAPAPEPEGEAEPVILDPALDPRVEDPVEPGVPELEPEPAPEAAEADAPAVAPVADEAEQDLPTTTPLPAD